MYLKSVVAFSKKITLCSRRSVGLLLKSGSASLKKKRAQIRNSFDLKTSRQSLHGLAPVDSYFISGTTFTYLHESFPTSFFSKGGLRFLAFGFFLWFFFLFFDYSEPGASCNQGPAPLFSFSPDSHLCPRIFFPERELFFPPAAVPVTRAECTGKGTGATRAR